jgi:hypothetical protein
MLPTRTRLFALAALLSAAGAAGAATPEEIDAAVKKGAEYLKKSERGGKVARDADQLGARALAGLALLETGTPAGDPAVKAITEAVRDASFAEVRTYQVALFVLYLDRLGDPADVPLIQMLGVRLVAGQNANGGWTYNCVPPVPKATETALRTRLGEATLTAGKAAPKAAAAGKPGKPAASGKLHAEVEKYRHSLQTTGARPNIDDNSNTQFGVLGTWTARKHGVPAEHALDLIEKRFLATQTPSGGWPYSGWREGSPAMTCAGLLGLAVAVGRREERLLKAEVPKPPAPKAPAKKVELPPGADPKDPFYNPPAPKEPEKAEKPVKPKAKRPADARDRAVQRGMDNLAAVLAGEAIVIAPGKGKGKGRAPRGDLNDLYFFWSLERVGVIFGVEKVGKTDWYAFGVEELLPLQNPNGSWDGSRGPEIDTAFALLFLGRSNLFRDLSAKVQKDPFGAELRAGSGSPLAAAPEAKPAPAPMPKPVDPPARPAVEPKPAPAAGTTPATVATELFRATGENWSASLKRVRDAKGAENTSALLAVIPLLDGARQQEARDALAERLARMNAATLRGMLKAADAELRRAAALACAMKDDKAHAPDLVGALEDKDPAVAKAARAGLKSLTGKDFATPGEWRAWLAAEKE